MQPKGSITIFFVLLLSIVLSLIGTLLVSAKVSAGRTQIAIAADQALFSAMAKYDRPLFDEYHLLYIDGSYGTGTLQLGKALDEIESDMSYLLTPNKQREIMGGINFLQLERMSGSITGYTLATDCGGSVFFEQVVSYMKETLGLQGISYLYQKMTSEKNLMQSQEDFHRDVEEQGNLQDYEDIKIEAASRQQSIENESTNTDVNINDNNRNQKALAKQAEQALDTISAVKENSILQLVLPSPQTVSGWTGDWAGLYRNRQIQTGMGYLELTHGQNDFMDGFLFQEYILQNLNHYLNERHSTGPSYGVEWVIFEKTSDIENLEAVVNRLMLIREAANVVSLYNDSNRFGQVRMMAEALAAVLKLPGIQAVLEGAITLVWAFAESIVDVRGLMTGESIPLVKKPDLWQVEFFEIIPAIQHPEQFYQESTGLTYEDYLRVLLLMKTEEEKVSGCIEVIEQSMRELPGKEYFFMDCAIDSLETEFQVRAQDLVTFTITEKRSYRTM